MSKDWYEDIETFHIQVMEENFPTFPHITTPKYRDLRLKLIKEEVEETLEAILKEDLVELADGICDSIVVLLGTAITYGIDIRPIWDEIHRTNMAKKGGVLREDGKRLKPEDWEPPNVAGLLQEQLQ